MCSGHLTPSGELMCQRGNKLYLFFWFDPLRRGLVGTVQSCLGLGLEWNLFCTWEPKSLLRNCFEFWKTRSQTSLKEKLWEDQITKGLSNTVQGASGDLRRILSFLSDKTIRKYGHCVDLLRFHREQQGPRRPLGFLRTQHLGCLN